MHPLNSWEEGSFQSTKYFSSQDKRKHLQEIDAKMKIEKDFNFKIKDFHLIWFKENNMTGTSTRGDVVCFVETYVVRRINWYSLVFIFGNLEYLVIKRLLNFSSAYNKTFDSHISHNYALKIPTSQASVSFGSNDSEQK